MLTRARQMTIRLIMRDPGLSSVRKSEIDGRRKSKSSEVLEEIPWTKDSVEPKEGRSRS